MTHADHDEEFEGVYVAHWEVARFVVTIGRGLFGRQKIEKWWPHFPADFELPDRPTGRGPGRTYVMRVRGRLGPNGHFGFKGMCSRELEVSEVLSCELTSTPGRTW